MSETVAPGGPATVHAPHEDGGNGGIILIACLAGIVLLALAIKSLNERLEVQEKSFYGRIDRLEKRVYNGPAGPEGNGYVGEGSGSTPSVDRASASGNGVGTSGDANS